MHSSYEAAVDRRSGKRDRTYRFYYDGRDSGKPGRKAKHVAAVSHRSYKGLVRSYDRNSYSRRVHRITKRQLNRGANAVADVAAAIKAAAKRLGNGGGDGGSNCSPAYPDFCIPPPPPDRNCDDVNGSNFTVKPQTPTGSIATAMGSAVRADQIGLGMLLWSFKRRETMPGGGP
jgi:hypothetical protein